MSDPINVISLADVWIGASVEDQKRAYERIPELVKIPAWGRFFSVEPLLEKVDIRGPCFNGDSPGQRGEIPEFYWNFKQIPTL